VLKTNIWMWKILFAVACASTCTACILRKLLLFF
jgi:hypothetical protein